MLPVERLLLLLPERLRLTDEPDLVLLPDDRTLEPEDDERSVEDFDTLEELLRLVFTLIRPSLTDLATVLAAFSKNPLTAERPEDRFEPVLTLLPVLSTVRTLS